MLKTIDSGCQIRSRLTLLLILLIPLHSGCGGQPDLMPIPGDATILAFGDSLTFGTGVPAHESYPMVLASLTGREVIRSGVPGEISSDGLKRLPSALREARPDLLVLCHGGNDILRRMSGSVTEANLREMIKLARSEGVQVVLVAVPKLGLFPEAQSYYKAIQQDLQVPVEFDVISDLESDRSMKSDQIHFNRKGYRRMAEAVHQMLQQSGAL